MLVQSHSQQSALMIADGRIARHSSAADRRFANRAARGIDSRPIELVEPEGLKRLALPLSRMHVDGADAECRILSGNLACQMAGHECWERQGNRICEKSRLLLGKPEQQAGTRAGAQLVP